MASMAHLQCRKGGETKDNTRTLGPADHRGLSLDPPTFHQAAGSYKHFCHWTKSWSSQRYRHCPICWTTTTQWELSPWFKSKTLRLLRRRWCVSREVCQVATTIVVFESTPTLLLYIISVWSVHSVQKTHTHMHLLVHISPTCMCTLFVHTQCIIFIPSTWTNFASLIFITADGSWWHFII